MLRFLSNVMSRLATQFVSEAHNELRFVARGALAYGPVMRGPALAGSSNILEGNAEYCSKVMLGIPLEQAYKCEGEAAPFGIYICESARSFAPDRIPLTGFAYYWWGRRHMALVRELSAALEGYYLWCLQRLNILGYPENSANKHRALAQEYLVDVPPIAEEEVQTAEPN